VQLTVSGNGSAGIGSWCAFRIVSSTPNGGGGDHDNQRNWVVGIEFLA
jgi:hypothetical protein